MDTVITIVHVAAAVGLIGLVLLQQGKGADMGAAFGSGASSTVFGSRGSASFLTRFTAGLATTFFITSLVLAYIAGKTERMTSVVDQVPSSVTEQTTTAPSDVPSQDAGVPAIPMESNPSDVPSPKQ